MHSSAEEFVEIRCPKCGRFLGEVKGYGRMVCSECASEIIYRDKENRQTNRSLLKQLLTTG